MSFDIDRLINDFGGPAKLAEAYNLQFPQEPLSRAAIYKWRERGSIPLAQINRLAELASACGKNFNIHHYSSQAGAVSPPAANIRSEAKMSDRLYIFDTTLRDGEQSPGASMTKDEKIRIAKQLEKLGVDVIEAGFAAASPGDWAARRRQSSTLKRTGLPSRRAG